MDKRGLDLYKKQQRRNNTSKKRQATFISEYVFVKYFDIYQEAAQLFNQINVKHPRKPDLRTSIEFKNWKREMRGMAKIPERQKRNPTNHIIYQNISVGQPHIDTHDVHEDNIARIVESLPKKTMQLKIQLLSPTQNPKASPQEEITANNDQVLDEVLDEGDIECLIPEEETIINDDQVLNQVPEEGNKDEVHSVQPSFFEDISPEMMGELLSELRADPNLAAIMDDFETSISGSAIDHQLDIGMEVEIDDRLERELEDTLLW